MSSDIDLGGLAVDRGGTGRPRSKTRRHLLTRYLLPLVLLLGFLSLAAWAARDLVFPPQPVTVVPVFATHTAVGREGTPLFNAAGWIEPRPTPVRVAALAPGVVADLLVVEDQSVRAGEPIAELVRDDARLSHDRALADLKLRQAELSEARATLAAAETRLTHPVHLEAAVGEAEAALAQITTQLKKLPFETRRAEADLEAARKDHESMLAAPGVVAGVEVDIAKNKVKSAEALVEELRDRAGALASERVALAARRDARKTQLELLTDEIKAKDEAVAKVSGAHARVEQARVVVAETELRLNRMTVKSPIDGRVFRLVAHPGARIGGGMTQMVGHDGSTIVTLYRPHMLQVRVDVRFDDILKVSLNQLVQINNPTVPSPLTGKVLFISSEADIQKNTLQVKVEIPDPPEVFKPEMLVDVTFLAPKEPERSEPSKERRLYVLEQLIEQDEAGKFVWQVDQSAGVARKSYVETGTVGTNGLVEITGGLTISSRIIANRPNDLRDGDRIIVSGEDGTLGTAISSEPAAPRHLPGEQ